MGSCESSEHDGESKDLRDAQPAEPGRRRSDAAAVMRRDLARIERERAEQARKPMRNSIEEALLMPMHFTVVCFGDGNNGQTSIWRRLQGKPMVTDASEMKLEPEAKELRVKHQGICYRISLIDAGEGIEGVDEANKQCFDAADFFLLVFDMCQPTSISMDNIVSRWLPVIHSRGGTNFMLVGAKKDKFEANGGDTAALRQQVDEVMYAEQNGTYMFKYHGYMETSSATGENLGVTVHPGKPAKPAAGSLLAKLMEAFEGLTEMAASS